MNPLTAENAALRSLCAELVGALEAELAELEQDRRWAEGSDMERFIARCEQMEAALAHAKELLQ